MTFLLETIRLGLSNLRLHMLRSFLTALGIIIGVSAVVTMVSIGEGSKAQALMQIERLGARNIIIRSQKPPQADQQGQSNQSFTSKFGLTRTDLGVIEEMFPHATAIVPLKELGSQVLRGDKRKTSQAFGTTPDMFEVAQLKLERGRYLTQADLDARAGARAMFGALDEQLLALTLTGRARAQEVPRAAEQLGDLFCAGIQPR